MFLSRAASKTGSVVEIFPQMHRRLTGSRRFSYQMNSRLLDMISATPSCVGHDENYSNKMRARIQVTCPPLAAVRGGQCAVIPRPNPNWPLAVNAGRRDTQRKTERIYVIPPWISSTCLPSFVMPLQLSFCVVLPHKGVQTFPSHLDPLNPRSIANPAYDYRPCEPKCYWPYPQPPLDEGTG